MACLLRIGWLVEAGIGRDLTDAGLSDADYHLLASLSETPGHRMRITDLAARISWPKSRLSHQLSRMQARGLVCRSSCPTDARGALAVLTPAGLKAIQAAAPGHVESIRRHLLGRLSPEQVEALAGITETVLAGRAVTEAVCAEAGEEDGALPRAGGGVRRRGGERGVSPHDVQKPSCSLTTMAVTRPGATTRSMIRTLLTPLGTP